MGTALDKRHHHVLTMSDLLDNYKGDDINKGLPPLGLRGIASSIIVDAMNDTFDSIITEALTGMLEKELLAPRGPPTGLPDVNRWLRKRELEKKQAARGKKSGKGGTAVGDPIDADDLSALDGDANRSSPRGRKSRKSRKARSGDDSEGYDSPASGSGRRRKGKKGGKTGRSSDESEYDSEDDEEDGARSSPRTRKKKKSPKSKRSKKRGGSSE